MAWLARSIANSLKIDEEEDDQKETIKTNSIEESGSDQPSSPSVLQSQSPRGVKEDISELTKTLRSQLWGVASFLAPPPSSSETADHVEETRKSSDLGEGDEDLIAGIRNDFVEIGGRFRTGISKLSGNLPVSEFTKMASNFLQLGSEGVDSKVRDVAVGNAIGVTEEVVLFARDLALHPETWLDFPFPDEDDNFDDFEMTDAQYEHALAVENLASSLAALRVELCPAYMSEYCFWRIYFVLVHPLFSKHDALILSTPQVLESRALLSHELLHKRNKGTGADSSNVEPLSLPTNPSPKAEPEPVKTITVETIHSTESSEFETEKHTVESKEIQVVDKPVIEERPAPAYHDKPVQSPVTGSSPRVIDVQVDDDADADADDWLKDEDNAGTVSAATHHLVQDVDEDVSFSDLEEDDDDVPVSYKK
ncbi:BSD domain [Arabidopsis thaliana x Arabidopsis arenosa]|uniref:BSD domain n=1 Tax=Arabidopsis thaliana x Arabidopsis arenosa TaxID=1240361 RepID=A0A8T1ZNV2_9BRAS|nr:BSD domain [Arabidopsis thaliana x Arabidopsis arenosa]